MAIFQRLSIILFFLAASLTFSNYSQAQTVTAPPILNYSVNIYVTGQGSSSSAACNDSITKSGAANPSWNYSLVSVTETTCTVEFINKSSGGSGGTQGFPTNGAFVGCPATFGWNGTTCSKEINCVAPQVFDSATNSCKDSNPCLAKAGTQAHGGLYPNGSSPLTPFPNSSCEGGCNVTFTGIWPNSRSCENGSCIYYAKGYFTYSGAQCTGGSSTSAPVLSEPMSPEQAALKALKDQQQADADAFIAAKRAEDAAFNAALAANAGNYAAEAAAKKLAAEAAQSKSQAAAAEAKAAAAKAAADAAAAEAVNNDPNSTQAQKDAATGIASVSGAAAGAAGTAAGAAAGAASTAASAAAAAAGTAATAEKTPEQKTPEQLCEAFPNSPACLVHTADSGFCVNGQNAGFKCDGDAITCAALKQQADSQCANLQKDGLTDFGQSLINQESTFTSTVGSIDNPESITVSQLNTSSFLSKSCLSDMNFSINGQNITLPLSALCSGLQTAGRIVKFFAFMIAARIIFS